MSSGAHQPIRVLCVDDDAAFVNLVAAFLERESDRVTVATETSGDAGLERLASADVDCVVSDYEMPGLDGLAFLDRVREEYSDLPFLLFTGKGSEEIASEAISRGVTDYLQKGSGTERYELLANRIENAVDSDRAARRAARVERIRTIVGDINRRLVRASSRAELERGACEILADTDPYRLVWFGEVDPDTGSVVASAAAGDEEAYLEEAVVTADDSGTGRGPTGTAVATGDVQVVQDICDDPAYDPWREQARERGFESSAALPVVHDGTRYGVLNVYADRTDAFDDEERELLGAVAADIAYAMAAVETRDELRRETRRFERFVGAVSGHAVFTLDREGRIASWNDDVARLTGRERDEVVGSPLSVLSPGDSGGDGSRATLAAADRDGRAERDGWYARPDGARFRVRETVTREDHERDGARYTVVVEDVEANRRDDVDCRALREAVERSDHPTCVVDREGVVEYVNHAFEDVSGYSASEAVGRPLERLRSDLYDDTLSAERSAAMSSGEGWRGEVLNADASGETYLVDQTVAPVVDEDGETARFVVVDRPLAGRQRSEARLQEQKFKVTALHEVAAEIEACDDPEEVFRRVLEAAEDILDFDMAIVDTVEGDQLVPVAVSSGVPEEGYFETTPLDAEDNFAAYAYRTGESTVVEDLAARDVAPAAPRYRSALTVPIGEYGTFQAVDESVGAFENSDRELAELLAKHARETLSRLDNERELRERSRQLERQNERLDEFAGIVSHDLRTPLSIAQGRVQLLAADCESDHLESISTMLGRMDTLIEDTLRLARQGETVAARRTVDVGELVTECCATMDRSRLTSELVEDFRLRADPDRLRQVFENLLQNAVDHGDGDVTVRIGPVGETGFYVEDDGPGIPPEKREEVFDAGHTTAEDGTGFGLAIVERIVGAHGWELSVAESDAGGVRFEVTGVESLGRPD